MKIYIVLRACDYDFDSVLYVGACKETAETLHKADEFGTRIHESEVELG